MTLLEDLAGILGAAFEAEGFDAGYGAVRVSDRPDLAQFQCNGALAAAKSAAKSEKLNPRALGERIAGRLDGDDRFSDVGVAGPGFVNINLSDTFLSQRATGLAGDERLGGWSHAVPEKVVLDFGGPNVAKPLHVGHLRSAIIGESLKRLLRFAGDDVVGDIHLGDWGLQMGQLISELALRQPDLPYFNNNFDGPYPETPPIALSDLEEMYPAASAACKADPERAEAARRATKQLQDGHKGYRALWRGFVDLSVDAMRRNYADLNVVFDLWKGESDADPYIEEIVSDLRAREVAVESDGALVVPVSRADDKKEMPPLILVNSQGAVGYHATDIATIVDRKRSQQPDRIFYVVDNRQSLHFEQVFRAVDKAGYFDEHRLEHLGFGTMQGPDGKPFKTREGGVLKLRDLIDLVSEQAIKRLGENGLASEAGDAEQREIARKVGVAALKFADLSSQRTTDYIFDLDRFMAFEGKTGPYLLYASVRVKSVLRRAADKGETAGAPIAAAAKEERDLALCLLGFSDAVKSAHQKRMPHFLCEHAYALAQAFSKFYGACRILDEKDDAVRGSRLTLADAAGRQLTLTLSLLGIETPDRM